MVDHGGEVGEGDEEGFGDGRHGEREIDVRYDLGHWLERGFR